MKFISILTISAAILYLYLTVSSLHVKVRTTSRRLLAAASSCLMFWAVFSYFIFNAADEQQLRLLFLIGTTGLFLFLPLQHMVVRSLYGKLSLRSILPVTIPCIILLIRNNYWDVTFSDFYFENGHWVFVQAKGSIWNLMWKIYLPAVYVYGLIVLRRRYRNTELNREKKQIKMLIYASSLTTVLAYGQYASYSFLSHYIPVSLSPILLCPWAFGFVLAVNRYQLLSISPQNVTRRLLNTIDELIILVDFSGKPVYLNPKAQSLLEGLSYSKSSLDFSLFLNTENSNGSPFPALKDKKPVKKKLILHSKEADSVLPNLDVEISGVKDKFGDPLGYLLIAKEVSTSGRMYRNFNLSGRETDIANGLVNGLKTRTIADNLGIAERTVKTHISNIYKKTGVEGRVELISLFLREDD